MKGRGAGEGGASGQPSWGEEGREVGIRDGHPVGFRLLWDQGAKKRERRERSKEKRKEERDGKKGDDFSSFDGGRRDVPLDDSFLQ